MMFADTHISSAAKKQLCLCFSLDLVLDTCVGNEKQSAARELLRALKFCLILICVQTGIA